MSHGVAFVVWVVGVALVWALPAFALGRIARRRGRRFWPWFVVALGPSAVAVVLRAPVALVVILIVVWVVLELVVLLVVQDRSKPDEVRALT